MVIENDMPRASLLFAGDIYPSGTAEVGANASLIYGNVLPKLFEADFAVANLECPITTSNIPIEKIGVRLKALPSAVAFLASGNFKAVCLANNHILDYGSQGLKETQSVLSKAGIRYFGAGDNIADASSPLIVEVKGIKIGLLAVCECGFSNTTGESPRTNPIDMERLKDEIPTLRSLVDVLIVCVHAGNEYFPFPNPFRRSQYQRLVDYGADAIIGHHPHVVQGIEMYRNRFIFYSLGNFFFPFYDMTLSEEWYQSYLVELKISKKGVTDYELFPVIQSRNFSGIELMDDRLRDDFIQRVSWLSKITTDDDQLIKYWDAYCLRMFKYYIRPLLIGATRRRHSRSAARLILHYLENQDFNELIKNACHLHATNTKTDPKTEDSLERLIGKITWRRKIDSFLRRYILFQDLNICRVLRKKIKLR